MKPENKELLLKDLCARLPYGVICRFTDTFDGCEVDNVLHPDDITDMFRHRNHWDSRIDVKPYLRPMSSMTEEEKKELKFMCDIGPETLTNSSWINGEFGLGVMYKNKASICVDAIDWLNKNMFDFRGLIPKGHALSTEEYNPYKE